jgi:hypothetical protein
VQHAPLLADPLRVLRQFFLAPAVVHRLQQRNQRGGGGDQHLVAHALLDEVRAFLQGRVVDAFTRQKHHHELGRAGQLAPVALGRQLEHMGAHLVSVPAQLLAASGLVGGCIDCSQVGLQRYLGIHYYLMTIGQVHDQIGPQPAIVQGFLLHKIAVLDHARQLDHALELDFAPAAAHRRGTQRAHQVPRLLRQLVVRGRQAGDQRVQPAVGLAAFFLDLTDVAVHLLQGIAHRLQQ